MCGSVANASDTQAVYTANKSYRIQVRASSRPLINFIKWILQYYLEVILYICV